MGWSYEELHPAIQKSFRIFFRHYFLRNALDLEVTCTLPEPLVEYHHYEDILSQLRQLDGTPLGLDRGVTEFKIHFKLATEHSNKFILEMARDPKFYIYVPSSPEHYSWAGMSMPYGRPSQSFGDGPDDNSDDED